MRALARVAGLRPSVVLVLAVCAVVGISTTLALSSSSVQSARADASSSAWQLSGAPYRMDLAITDSSISSTLTDFPVKVVLTPSNFNYADDSSNGTAADASSSDLGFVLADDSTDTQLPYEVDTWNPGGTSVLWVQVPSVSSTESDVELYYGPGGAYTGPAAGSAVFSNGYTAVNQFTPSFTGVTSPTLSNPLGVPPESPSEAGTGDAGLPTGTTFSDLLGNASDLATLANNGPTSGADFSNEVLGSGGSSAAGQAVELSGNTSGTTGTYLTLPDTLGDNNGTETLSTEVYTPSSSLTGTTADAILGQHYGSATPTAPGTQQGAGGTGAIFMAEEGGCIYVPIYTLTGGSGAVSGTPGSGYTVVSDCGAGNAIGGGVESGKPALTAGWHTIDVVLNGTSETLYIDGTEVSTNTLPADVNSTPTSPFIMGQYSNGGPGAGDTAWAFDDLTISNVARSSDWIQAEHASESNQLISYGSAQEVSTPTGVTVSGTGSTATIAWNAVSGATEYNVYEGDTPGAEGATPVATVSGPTAQITGLTSDTKYYFTVAAVTNAGTSLPSSEVTYAWVMSPTDLSATAFSDGSTVELNWTAAADATSATTYSVYEGTSSGGESATPVSCVALSPTSCLVTGLSTATQYFFTIAANGSGATSAPSAEASTTTPGSNTDGQTWQLPGAEYRLPLEVGDATLVDTLNDFPVKVVLTPQNFDYAGDAADGNAADASSNDLAFVLAADSGSPPTQLPYQVDTWNPGGTSILWVELPQFVGNVALNNLELYYGGSATYAGPNAAGTWSNGYDLVNEFNANLTSVSPSPTLSDPLPQVPESPSDAGAGEPGLPTGLTFPDVLGGASDEATLMNDGATGGADFSNAVLGDAGSSAAGQAVQLSGETGGNVAGEAAGTGGTYLSLPASVGDSTGVETLSATVYVPQSAITAGDTGTGAAILGQHYASTTVTPPGTQQGAGGTGALFMALGEDCLYVPVYYGPGTTYNTVSTCGTATTTNATNGSSAPGQAPITAGWHTVDVVLDGTSETLYIDGVVRSTNTMPEPVNTSPTSPFIMGQYSNPSEGYSSAYGFDQLTVAGVARSSSWIQAEYASQENELITYASSASISTPTGVTATGSGNSVTIAWNAVSGASQYDVYEGTTSGGESATPVTCASSTATSCTISGLPSATAYFTVSAVTASGTSLPSAEVSYTYLSPPTNVSAEAISDSSVSVSWSAVNDAASYSVYEGTTAGGESATAVSCQTLTPTSCLITGLTDGDTYHFTVGADSSEFTSVPSAAEASATPGSQSAWTVPSAAERVPVTLNAGTLSSDLTDFPVQVQLPASFDYADASQTNLVFTLGADATPLPYQVENWNPSGVSTIWVQLPALAPADPPLYMYYNGAPTDTIPATDVWDSNFLGVYHFNDAAGSTTIADSTANANNGTITYNNTGTGSVDFQQTGEDGSPSMIETAANQADLSFGSLGEGLSQFTFSASVGVDATDAGLGEIVVGGRNATGGTEPGEQFSLLSEDDNWVPTIESGTNSAVASTDTYQGDGQAGATQITPACTSPVSFPSAGWQFYDLAMTYDGTDLRFYVNGTEICTVPFSGPLEPGDLPFTLGLATPGGLNPPSMTSTTGGLDWGDFNWDEMRLSDVARSSDWIAAESLADTGALASTGASQTSFSTTGAFIDGTPQIGDTLTADTSGFSPAASLYSYQWFDNGSPIFGATGPTLALTPSILEAGVNVGDQLTVQITGSYDGTTLSPVSQPVTVLAGKFTPGTPTISGPAEVGGTLVANPGDWIPAGTVTYQWLLDGQPISGATSSSYTLIAADAGQPVSVEVTEASTGYTTDSATAAAVTVATSTSNGGGSASSAPLTGTPTISGTVQVAQTVTASPGSWSPSATPSYQWLLSGQPISGATASSYTVTAADAGGQLSVQVTESPAGIGSESAQSAGFEVQPGSFSTGTPAITGQDTVGSTLSAGTGNWSPAPVSFGYQWLLNGQPISGATFSTYVVPTADSGQAISVTVYGEAPGIQTASATASSVTITPAALSEITAPSVSGTVRVGDTLTASSGTWTPAPTTVGYQWLAGGAPIAGATHATFTVPAADAAKALSVQVTVTAAGYAATTLTSAATKVADGKLVSVKRPVIKGNHRVGAELSVGAGTWSAKPTRLSYQWLRDGQAIRGATRASLRPTRADAGAELSVKVTATLAGYTNASVTTAKVMIARGRA